MHGPLVTAALTKETIPHFGANLKLTHNHLLSTRRQASRALHTVTQLCWPHDASTLHVDGKEFVWMGANVHNSSAAPAMKVSHISLSQAISLLDADDICIANVRLLNESKKNNESLYSFHLLLCLLPLKLDKKQSHSSIQSFSPHKITDLHGTSADELLYSFHRHWAFLSGFWQVSNAVLRAWAQTRALLTHFQRYIG